jgi:transposase-like protein
MTKEDAKEYSEIWSKNLITALNQVEVMLKKGNIKPTQEQLKEIVGLAKENATQNAKTIMIDKGAFEEREKEEPVDFMEEIKEMIKEIEP